MAPSNSRRRGAWSDNPDLLTRTGPIAVEALGTKSLASQLAVPIKNSSMEERVFPLLSNLVGSRCST